MDVVSDASDDENRDGPLQPELSKFDVDRGVSILRRPEFDVTRLGWVLECQFGGFVKAIGDICYVIECAIR